MSKPGQALENYNRDLVKLISEFKTKATHIATTIETMEVEKNNIEAELRRLTQKLETLNTQLDVQRELKVTTAATIQRTEFTYMKILENSLDLLTCLKDQQD